MKLREISSRRSTVALALAACFSVITTESNALPQGGVVAAGAATIASSVTTIKVMQATNSATYNWQSFNIGKTESVHFQQPSATSVALNYVLGNTNSIIDGSLTSNGQMFLSNPNGILFGATAQVNVAGLTLQASNGQFANAGAINVNGGSLIASAKLINNSGLIEASSATQVGGKVVLSATNSISNSGSLRASGIQGGSVLLTSGAAGTTKVIGLIDVSSTIGKGGNIEVLGNLVGLFSGASINASGQVGGGSVLIGGNFHGAGSQLNASQAIVDKGASINADAITHGNGGNVAVWSDVYTQFRGMITAKGGVWSGNGGFAETSGKQFLAYAGVVDTRAAKGAPGTLLLDPTDITIAAAPALTTATNTAGTFASTVNAASVILNTDLQNQLALSNVVVSTTSGLAGVGNITINAPISWNSAFGLTLNASGLGGISSSALGSITSTGAGGLTLNTISGTVSLLGTVSLMGTMTVNSGSSVSLGGGNMAGLTINTAGAVTLAGTTNPGALTVRGAGGIGNAASFTGPAFNFGINGTGVPGAITINSAGAVSILGALYGSSANITSGGSINLATTGTFAGLSKFSGSTLAINGSTAGNVSGTFGGGVSFTSTLANSPLVLGNLTVTGPLSVSAKGAISQAALTSVSVTGATTLTANNGAVAPAVPVRYAITLANAGNNFVGAVTTNGLGVSLQDSVGGIVLGNVTATGVLNVTSRGGAITQAAATKIGVTGATTLVANDGAVAPWVPVSYAITLNGATNDFVGKVNATGLGVSLLDSAGGIVLGNVTAGGALIVTSRAGGITQAAATKIAVTGATTLTAQSAAVAPAVPVKYAITLANSGNNFVGAVTTNGFGVSLLDSVGGIILGNTNATGALAVTSRGGAITQAAATTAVVNGATTLTANNGAVAPAVPVRYGITLANATNNFGGLVTANGLTVMLADLNALNANVNATGATSLSAGGALNVAGVMNTTLTTKTTGALSTTTFGATTVGTSLAVTSTGAVKKLTPATAMTVAAVATTVANPKVTVNGVVGALIP